MLWDFPGDGGTTTTPRVLVGRQTIFAHEHRVHGYELFFRSATRGHVHVDRWSARQQDRATGHVISAAFSGAGLRSLAADRHVFVNFTRSFLVADLVVPAHPEQLVVEVVESVPGDDAVLAGLAALRRRGHRIALDDFVGSPSQRRMLALADYVKIDLRDIARHGEALVDLARSRGARLIAECVETEDELRACHARGFDFFQGDALEPTLVVDRGGFIPSQRALRGA